MKPKRAAVVVGLVGIAGLGVSCNGGKGSSSTSSGTGTGADAGTAAPAATQVEDKELRDYLSKTGPMYKWETQTQDAICQLEKFSSVPAADRTCPGGTPSGTPPPSYPPK
jgi:hypothetical protein